MHSNIIAAIRQIIASEVAQGKTVDVEAYCRLLHPKCPELTKKEFEDLVLQAVADCGGSAFWGGSESRRNGSMPRRE